MMLVPLASCPTQQNCPSAAGSAHRGDYGARFAVANQIGCSPTVPKAGIVSGSDHGAVFDQLAESYHLHRIPSPGDLTRALLQTLHERFACEQQIADDQRITA